MKALWLALDCAVAALAVMCAAVLLDTMSRLWRWVLFGAFAFACSAQAATFKTDVTFVAATKGGWSYDWAAWIVDGNGAQVGTASLSYSGGTSSGSPNLNANVASVTRNADFYIVVGYSNNGLWGGSGRTFVRWISAYEVGGTEPQQSSSGPYSGAGAPTDANGAPVNPMSGNNPPPLYYEHTINLSAPLTGSVVYIIEVKNATTNAVIGTHQKTVAAGPDISVVLRYTVAFTYTVRKGEQVNKSDGTKPFLPVGPTLSTGSSTPVTQAPEPVIADTMAGYTAASGASGGGYMSTGTASTNDTTAVANQTRPGTTEGNEEARHAELRGELQRVTAQTRNSGDSVKSAIEAAGDKIADALGSDGVGEAFDQGGAVGTSDEGALGFITGLPTRLSNLGSAMGNLKTALGLGSVGSATPSWTITIFGRSTTVSLAGQDFSFVRALALWAISLGAVWQAVGIIRGTFADEGAK